MQTYLITFVGLESVEFNYSADSIGLLLSIGTIDIYKWVRSGSGPQKAYSLVGEIKKLELKGDCGKHQHGLAESLC